MIEFAYVTCGLSIDAFMQLSFYEWDLEVRRAKKKIDESHKEWEGQAALTREFMALTANINRRKGMVPFKGKDFIKLSFDKEDEGYVSKRMTPEEVEAKFGKYTKNG